MLMRSTDESTQLAGEQLPVPPRQERMDGNYFRTSARSEKMFALSDQRATRTWALPMSRDASVLRRAGWNYRFSSAQAAGSADMRTTTLCDQVVFMSVCARGGARCR
jgi:hypothetical protein